MLVILFGEKGERQLRFKGKPLAFDDAFCFVKSIKTRVCCSCMYIHVVNNSTSHIGRKESGLIFFVLLVRIYCCCFALLEFSTMGI